MFELKRLATINVIILATVRLKIKVFKPTFSHSLFVANDKENLVNLKLSFFRYPQSINCASKREYQNGWIEDLTF